MWTDVSALFLIASVIMSGSAMAAEKVIAPTTLSIADLDVLAQISNQTEDRDFLRWNEAKSKDATQKIDLGEALPIANFICKVQALAIKSCVHAVPRSMYDSLYWPLLSRVRFSPSEEKLAGTEQRIVAVSISKYVDSCAGTRCSFTPPPPPAPPADAD
jgi:hypothetical protein